MSTTLEPACPECGGLYSFASMTVEHKTGCRRDPQNRTLRPVANLAVERMERRTNPKDNRPSDALDAARQWIAEQDAPPEHVIVLIGRTTGDNASGTKYFQAGSYPHHAQMGLIEEAKYMIRES